MIGKLEIYVELKKSFRSFRCFGEKMRRHSPGDNCRIRHQWGPKFRTSNVGLQKKSFSIRENNFKEDENKNVSRSKLEDCLKGRKHDRQQQWSLLDSVMETIISLHNYIEDGLSVIESDLNTGPALEEC